MPCSIKDKTALMPDLAAHLFERSPMLFLAFDAQGRVICANHGAEEMFPEPIFEQTLDRLFVDFQNELRVETLGHDSEPRLLSIQTKNNQPVSYLFSFKKRTDGILLAFGDLDYAQSHFVNESLFESVNEISNLTRELQKTNAELKRINDLKNQYLGITAHDLRNPVGTIQGFSEFLIEELAGSVSSANMEIMEMILEQSRYMFGLINSYLDYAAIESGKMNVDLQPTDLGLLVKHCFNIIQPMAQKKEIIVAYERPQETMTLSADAHKLQQVINNLLSNALKFSYPQSTITLKLEDRGRDYGISVSDQGQGIPQQEQEKLFKPFSQTSVRSTTGEKSTGLGLSIVKKIVEAHQGRIEVESEVGKGTTFLILLPKTM